MKTYAEGLKVCIAALREDAKQLLFVGGKLAAKDPEQADKCEQRGNQLHTSADRLKATLLREAEAAEPTPASKLPWKACVHCGRRFTSSKGDATTCHDSGCPAEPTLAEETP